MENKVKPSSPLLTAIGGVEDTLDVLIYRAFFSRFQPDESVCEEGWASFLHTHQPSCY